MVSVTTSDEAFDATQPLKCTNESARVSAMLLVNFIL